MLPQSVAAVLLLMIPLSGAASAQSSWEPPNIGSGGADPVGSVAAELIPKIGIGDVQVILDITPLLDVVSRFKAQPGHRGDANDSLDWICLHGKNARGGWILWLESGEIHVNRIGAFQLRRLEPNQRVDARCRIVNAVLQIPSELRLGMSREEVRRMLGGSIGAQATSSYVYEREDPNGVTVESIVTVAFTENVVVAFEVWKTETN